MTAMKNTLKEISLTLQGTALRPTGSGLFPAKESPKGEMTQFFEHSQLVHSLKLSDYEHNFYLFTFFVYSYWYFIKTFINPKY